MFAMSGGGDFGNIGQRNIETVKRVMQAEGLKIRNQEVGGNSARTMLIELETGTVKLRTIGKPERVL